MTIGEVFVTAPTPDLCLPGVHDAQPDAASSMMDEPRPSVIASFPAMERGRAAQIPDFILLWVVFVLLAILTLACQGVDLDRPQDGLINISQKPLTEVQRWMGLPAED